MTVALLPLSMSTIGMIPQPCRSCVFWELGDGAATVIGEGHAAFEKEVWLSGVMLTWGSAGLIITVDEQPAGFALFAPPPTVPATSVFGSGPVSADAVLMTALRVREEFAGRGVGTKLVEGVVTALTRRGVRAIEVFGRESAQDDAPVMTAGHCAIPAGFARSAGFVDVRADPHYPRLRIELSGGLQWKAEVEAALELLVTKIPAGAVSG